MQLFMFVCDNMFRLRVFIFQFFKYIFSSDITVLVDWA